jgi:hypothetical protein
MFIRIKKVKGMEYAYKVKNKWTKKGPRQKTVKYLGRVHNFEKKKELDFLQENKITNPNDYAAQKKWPEIVNDLLICELKSHGFRKKDNVWLCKGCTVDLNQNTILKGSKVAVLAMNEGFLCNETLQQALTFKPEGIEKDIAYDLANVLVSAGIATPEQLFISLYEKIMK